KGDKETRRQGGKETRRQGDKETRRQGDKETRRTDDSSCPLSPCLLVSLSPCHEWHHAPVFATLAAAAGSVPTEALAVYLHQAALGVVSAGVRTIPIGHSHGQEVLARLHGDIEMLAKDLAERPLETAGSFCPAYEVLCHAQSHLYTRLFRS